jgi:hypothetical protein
MNTRELHTPVPLSDDDYAAVRAGVLAELAAEKRRRRFIIAFAAAATLAFAAWLLTPEPVPTHVEPQKVRAKAVVVTDVSPSTVGLKPVTTTVEPVAFRKPHRSRTVKPSEPLRIELHTHDPDIRIIWIVTPDKEES